MMELFCEKKEKIPIWQFSIYAFDIYLIQQTYQDIKYLQVFLIKPLLI